MHTKQKGVIGVWSVATHLVKLGYPVFIELSDLSKTDIIVLIKDIPIKVQVKSITSKNGLVSLKGTKAAHGYRFKYTIKDIDIFAVYVLDTGQIAFVGNTFLKTGDFFCLRINPTKNKQTKGVHLIEQYQDFTRVLRDYTRNIPKG